MSPSTRTTRITSIAVGGVALAVIAGTAFAAHPGGGAAADAPAAVASTSAAASDAPSADPAASADPTASDSAQPTPQQTTQAPLQSAVPIRTDLVAKVTKVESVAGKATLPGEVAGPAVRFTIRLTNTTGSAFDLSNAVVNAASGEDADPAYPLTQPGGKPFPTSVPAGGTVTGVYVFTIPTDERDRVSVSIDTSTDTPVVAFTGPAPR